MQEPDIDLEVTWIPFELHSDTPDAGLPLAQYFGVPTERVQSMQQGLKDRATELGLPFEAPEWLANTRKAHRLSEYARDLGKIDELHREMFRANFVDGRNLADDAVLAELAARVGIDADEALRAAYDERYEERLVRAGEQAREAGITGVPAFIVEDRYKIVGAHPYEALRDAFRRIASELSQ